MGKVFKTMDGNSAAAYVSYAFTDVAAIYPITPSSDMAQHVDEMAAYGKKNIFGQEVLVSELQSEGGAAGAVHGSLQGGALTTTYTASQGLLLMIPNMYKIAGELLPCVFHVSARAVATHALSIFGDHSDVMAARQTGFAMLASGSVQEVMDLAGVAHLSTIKTRVPFVHFFDGFRTSHEISKIELIDYSEFERLVDMDAVQAFRNNSLNPERPVTRGTAQNPDIFFQAKEASNNFYEAVPAVVQNYMEEISKVTGRTYNLFDYYGAEDADRVVIAMGSVVETIEETIDYLVAKGEKVGMIKVRLYRPFAPEYLLKVLPKTVTKIAVLDRTKEPGAIGEPLYLDIRSMFYRAENAPEIVGGRYGLGSNETNPSQIKAVFDMLNGELKDGFTIGINDDVTNLSLDIKEEIVTETEGTTRCMFWGLGSDGTVGANKSAIKIIGDKTDLYAQGYFSYDSKKSYGITVSHLRFGKEKIRSTYLITESDYVACHNQSYVVQYDMMKGLRKGGTFVLNTQWTDAELNEHLPAAMKNYIAKNDIKFYTINAFDIAEEIGLGNRINMVMQSAFFKLAEVIDVDDAMTYLKEAIVTAYGKKGQKIVDMNNEAVDAGVNALHLVEVPADWATATEGPGMIADGKADDTAFITNILRPVSAQKGNDLPVSTFVGVEDGTFENGSTAYEKRAIATVTPEWQVDNCIQCNQCALVCPHAVIRPYLLDAEEVAKKPESFVTKKAIGKGMEGLEYKIQVSTHDCTGCGVCAQVCPSKEKSLIMKPFATQDIEVANYEFAQTITIKDDRMTKSTVKGSQFAQPLFEFSGACAGCGETAYMKAVTQLYGDRMIQANATGCSSIWGGSAPATPFTKNAKGHGPAWANSLFEDNAEYGYGMALGVKTVRNQIKAQAEVVIANDADLAETFQAWIDNMDDAEGSKAATETVREAVKGAAKNAEVQKAFDFIKANDEYLVKKSIWIVGGDGWAYDIGYGGLDHVIASGEDVNILVFDTEVYSNTGGQASKATPTAAVAKFAASGMKVKKKDLGMIATTYGYVYVAQVGMGANQNQFMKALQEAESYNGPSIIICYSPCIAHGLKGGMSSAQLRIKEAVAAGYWHLWRFDPRLKEQGKNPFILDSKEPTASYQDFIKGESRYTILMNQFPEEGERLFAKAEQDAKERYESYVRMANMKYGEE
jgi:pyruvate-ferredoxin/flavodoxin oxidoreductase